MGGNMRIFATTIICSAILIQSTTAIGSMCDAILQFGTYDEHGTYTSNQRFEIVKNAICRSNITTMQSAQNVGVNLGVDVVGIVEATLGVTTSEANFQNNKDAFCRKDFSKINESSIAEVKIKRASEVIANAWSTCVQNATGFKAWVVETPKKDGFTIHTRNNSQGVTGFQITSLNAIPSSVRCTHDEQKASPKKPFYISTREATIACTKDPNKAIQISMNTTAGAMPAVNLEGTAGLLEDLSRQVNLLQAFGANFPRGTILAWYATSGSVPSGWAICDGSNGTPDLRGRFLRGVGGFSDVAQPGAGVEKVSLKVQADPRRGSDKLWGDTPWKDAPNPARGEQILEFDNRPPFTNVLYIMKL